MDSERARILDWAREAIEEIDRLLVQTRQWNALMMSLGGETTNYDPNGDLAMVRAGLQEMIDLSAAKGHTGPLEAPTLRAFYATRTTKPNGLIGEMLTRH